MRVKSFLTHLGIICGLALYNQVQLNVNFPLVIYKKILESCPAASYTKRHTYEIALDDLKVRVGSNFPERVRCPKLRKNQSRSSMKD